MRDKNVIHRQHPDGSAGLRPSKHVREPSLQPLRRGAAAVARRGSRAAPAGAPGRTQEDLVHDLEVQRAGLEMQNEDLSFAQGQLEESRARLSALYDFAPVGYLVLDKAGTIREANLTALRLLGVSRRNLIGAGFHFFLSRESKHSFLAFYRHLRQVLAAAREDTKSQPRQTCELRLRKRDGTCFDAQLESIAMTNEKTNRRQCWTVLSDITARKQIEKEGESNRQTLCLALKAGRSGTFEWDTKTNTNRWSEELLTLYGLRPEEFGGRHEDWLAALVPEDREKGDALVQQSLKTGEFEHEFRIRRRDNGELRWMQGRARVFFDEAGKPARMIGINVDITERKRAEEALAHSRAQWAAMFAAMTDAAVLADAERRIAVINPAFTKMFGYSVEEALGRTTEFLYASARAYREMGGRRYHRRSPVETGAYEIRYRRKDGSVFWAETSGSPVRDARGETVGFVSIHREITKRKHAEEAVQREKESYRTLATNLPGLVFRVRLGKPQRMEMFNQSLFAMTGYREKELTPGEVCSIEPLIVAEDRAAVVAAVKRAIRRHQPFEVEYRLRTKAGELRHFSEHGQPVYGADGRCTHLDGVILDITPHKEAAARLQESQLRLSQLTENIREVFWLGSPDWKEVLYVSPGYKELWGRSCESLYQSPRSWMDAVVAEDRPAVRAAMEAGVAGKLPAVFPQYRVKRPDGTVRWVQARAWPVLDEAGRAYRIAGIAKDITERKEAEEAIRQQANLLRLSFDAIIVWQLDGAIESWNRGAEALYGYTEAEAIGHRTHDLLKTTHPAAWSKMKADLKTRGQWEGELRHRTKDGRELIILARHQLIRGDDGVARVLETNRDITERKQAEEHVRRQVKELAAANAELAQFNKAMVGRELRMIELKKEINALCARLGLPAEYPARFLQEEPAAADPAPEHQP